MSALLDEPAIVAALRAAGCVFAEAEARVLIGATDDPARLAMLVQQRVDGLPLEYVVGWAEFCGLRIAVEPGVFVPRFRSEFLAEQAVAHAPVGAVVLDMCCGVGGVAAAIASAVQGAEVHAAELDPTAVRCARQNLPGGAVYEGDLYDPLPPLLLHGRVDVLVANAPYVPTEAIASLHREARLYEPAAALDGGPDGLDVQRRVLAGAAPWLAPGGHVLVETSERQAAGSAAAFADAGLDPRIVRSDELEATVVVGSR